MVNPGAFTGLRKQFLDDQARLYAAAVEGRHVNDSVADIQRRYFKRFPITLPHTQEPSDESLAAVDDAAPDPEFKAPSNDGMEPAAYARARASPRIHISPDTYLPRLTHAVLHPCAPTLLTAPHAWRMGVRNAPPACAGRTRLLWTYAPTTCASRSRASAAAAA